MERVSDHIAVARRIRCAGNFAWVVAIQDGIAKAEADEEEERPEQQSLAN
jgi:hypothetical protein